MSNILVISPTPTHPQNAGNRTRIFSLLTNLQKNGYKIHFAFIDMEKNANLKEMKKAWDFFYCIKYHKPPEKLLRKIITKLNNKFNINYYLSYQIDDWYDPSIDEKIITIIEGKKINYVLVEYIFFSKILKKIPHNILKIIDTHDIFTNRHKMYIKNNIKPRWFYTSKTQEAKALNRADVILAIQKNETKFFSKLTKKKVITVGNISKLKKLKRPDNRYPILLFVGSKNYVNILSINYFIKEIMPKIILSFPKITLNIVGSICENPKIKDLPKQCKKIGFVNDLESYYYSCNIVINPLVAGTGLKIKTIEALSYGKPVITTTLGADGLEDGEGEYFLIADSASKYIEYIKKIFNDKDYYNNLSQNAFSYAKKYNEKCLIPLLTVLDD
jgi:glycosyltransferase involved in cell wall biosynthesis